MQQLPLGVTLPDHATFETFHPGPNGMAIAQLGAGARGELDAVSLFLSGRGGTGKTHLLQAVCGAACGDGRRAGYLGLREVVEAGEADGVLDGWAGLEVVCLDDVDAIAGQRAWETAIMRLYNTLQRQGGILVAGARPPVAELRLALPDLQSRLQAGLLVGLRVPGDDDAASALRLRAAARGLDLPPETAAWLLRRFRRDMHSLCALLDRLDEASLARRRRLTVPFVRELTGAIPPADGISPET